MASFEIVRRNDPRWFYVQPPKRQRKPCRSCVFNGYPVRMKVWRDRERFSWRCPSCAYCELVDAERFDAWVRTVT